MILLKEKSKTLLIIVTSILLTFSCVNTKEDKSDKSKVVYTYFASGNKKSQSLISPNGIDTLHKVVYSKKGTILSNIGKWRTIVMKATDESVILKVASIELDSSIKNLAIFDSKRNLLKTHYIDSTKVSISIYYKDLDKWKTESNNDTCQICLAWFNDKASELIEEKCIITTFNHLKKLRRTSLEAEN